MPHIDVSAAKSKAIPSSALIAWVHSLLCRHDATSARLLAVPMKLAKNAAPAVLCRTCMLPLIYDDESVRKLLRLTKYGRARAGANSMAAYMISLLRDLPSGVVLIPVPTASSRVRQ